MPDKTAETDSMAEVAELDEKRPFTVDRLGKCGTFDPAYTVIARVDPA